MKRILPLAIVIGLAALLLSLKALFWNGSALPSADARQSNGSLMAPDFKLEDVSSRRISLRDFRGRVVLLSFWTTW